MRRSRMIFARPELAILFASLSLFGILVACAGSQPKRARAAGKAAGPKVVETLEIADVWSGHPVRFALLTSGADQLAAFYDQHRNMTIALRKLGSASWSFARLPSQLDWDSHNHLAMAIDERGQIHVSGNMHEDPLVYFRTTRPLDITSFVRVASMVGSNEQSCTYPEFFRGPSGNLVFAYRDGSSGSGNHIFNTYDVVTGTWSRLLETPLIDGEGQRNAYPVGPIHGPDGDWHLVWVWRDTPDAATNHDLSYARSRDLRSFQAGSGQALKLPITLSTSDIVDPVPVHSGLINNNTKVGFDAQKRPIVAYHKYDENGNTQLYNARLEDGRWVVYKTTDFDYRWSFGGPGTLVFEIELDGVRALPDDSLFQDFYHAKIGGRGTLLLNPANLNADAVLPPVLPYPIALDQPQSVTQGMVVRWASDAGMSKDPGIAYMLRWETLESNRDLPRGTLPPPTKLSLYAFR